MLTLQMNPDVNAFQRKYVNDVRRCDEMERKLRFGGHFLSHNRFFETEIGKASMKFQGPETVGATAAPDTSEIGALEVHFFIPSLLERESSSNSSANSRS
jgi:hypothetical protein